MTFGREQTLVNSRADSNKWSSHFLKLAAYSPFENSRIPTAWIDSISPICNHAKNCNYMPGIPYITNFIWHSIFRRKYCLSGCFLKLQTTHSIQLIFIFRCHAQKMNQYDHNTPVSTHTHTHTRVKKAYTSPAARCLGISLCITQHLSDSAGGGGKNLISPMWEGECSFYALANTVTPSRGCDAEG